MALLLDFLKVDTSQYSADDMGMWRDYVLGELTQSENPGSQGPIVGDQDVIMEEDEEEDDEEEPKGRSNTNKSQTKDKMQENLFELNMRMDDNQNRRTNLIK